MEPIAPAVARRSFFDRTTDQNPLWCGPMGRRKVLPQEIPHEGDELLDETPIEDEAERLALGDLMLLDSPEVEDFRWSIWRLRTPEELKAGGKQWGLVCYKTGRLDPEALIAELGGGTFDIRGFKNGVMARKPRITIEGPRKDYRNSEPAVTTPVTQQANGHREPLSRAERIALKTLRALEAQNSRLAALEARSNGGGTSSTLGEMIQGLVALDTLRGKNAPSTPPNDLEIAKLVISTYGQGIEVGQARDPVPAAGGTDWVEVAKTVSPALQQFLSFLAHRRAAATGAPPPPPSGAAVVEPEQVPAGGGRELSRDDWNWIAAANALEQAIAEDGDPKDFAVSLELGHVLSRGQLAILKLGSADEVVKRLREYRPDSEILKAEIGPFVAAVLDELRNPTSDDPEDPPAGE